MILPKRFYERMEDMLGTEAEEFFNALDSNAVRSAIRINTLKDGAAEAVLSCLSNPEAVPWCKNAYYADKSEIGGNHPYHMGGLFYFQEPSAMSAAEALPIEEGDFILDLCAAPGGKATQAAAKLNGTGLIVANEIVKKRANILSENISRMGIKNAVVTNEAPQNLAKKYPQFFDKIIVDAPCSGEGMFRKEPRALTEWSEEHSLSCAVRQKNILDSAFSMLRDGGYLLYSTCTFSPDENERVVDYVLDNFDAEIVEIPNLSELSGGIEKYSAHKEIVYARRIFPHRQGGEGHFVALFKKSGKAELRTVRKTNSGNPLYREFEEKFLNTHLEGNFTLFGDRLYLMPPGIDIDKLKTVMPGLFLGVLKKNRFEPSQSLASALSYEAFKNVYDADFDEARRYLSGNTLPCGFSGWGALAYNRFPLGWGKASGGTLKNHYPKFLRLNQC